VSWAARVKSGEILLDGRQATFFGVGAGDGPESVRVDLSTLLDLLVRRQIQPVIGARLPLTEIGRAHRGWSEPTSPGRSCSCRASAVPSPPGRAGSHGRSCDQVPR
jgi:hypothetical protein